MDQQTETLIAQIDQLLAQFPAVKQSWFSSNMVSGFKRNVEYEAIITEAISLVTHIYGPGHAHVQRVIHAVNDGSLRSLEQIEGVLVGTRSNLVNGLLDDLRSRIAVDLKSGFLETAQQLAAEGQKDPAAVLGCIVLEDTLKRLATKHSIDNASDKEMSVVAGLLYSKGVLEKATNQTIQGFKGLRNASLHAQWTEVSLESVKLLLVFLPAFIEKHGL